ncbi:MAG: endonuclease/exonuclease/phosphatase family protein [Patescibacteria group bacterium]
MTIKLLQLNIEHGKRIETIVDYIRSGSFDIVCLQEVTSGKFSPMGINTYEVLRNKTELDGQLAPYVGFRGDVSSFFANATLWKRSYSLISSQVIWLKRYEEMTSVQMDFRKSPRSALAILFAIGEKKLMVVNTHLAWGPTPDDRVYQKNQAEKLYQWIKTHRQDPFVLTGDFNLNPHTFTVGRLSSLGNNLTKRFKITNTLNPRTHRVKALFPSGLPVDYIIADERLTIKKFFVEEKVDLSDHLGLIVEFSL